MAKKILYTDIVDENSLRVLLDSLTQIEAKLKTILKLAGEKMQGTPSTFSDIKKQVDAINTATEATKKLSEVEKQAKAIKEKLNEATIKSNLSLSEEVKVKKLQIQYNTAAEGSYNKLRAEYDLNFIALKKMGTAEKENTENGRRLIARQKELYEQMSLSKGQIGKSREELGRFKAVTDIANMSLGQMKKEFMALRKIEFTGKSKEEVDALKQRMGDLQDKMGDLRAEMAVLGGPGIGAVVGSLKFLSAGVESVVGSLSLFGVGEEQIKDLEKKLISLIAVTQALAEIEDVVNSGKLKGYAIKIKDMALDAKSYVVRMAGVIVTKAQTSAEEARMVMTSKVNLVTKIAAALQWAWNAAILASPIMWIVAAAAALAVGLYQLTKAQNVQTMAEEARAQAMVKVLEQMRSEIEYHARLAKAKGADLITTNAYAAALAIVTAELARNNIILEYSEENVKAYQDAIIQLAESITAIKETQKKWAEFVEDVNVNLTKSNVDNIELEYRRRRETIDSELKGYKGYAEAVAALERWRTAQLGEEAQKRFDKEAEAVKKIRDMTEKLYWGLRDELFKIFKDNNALTAWVESWQAKQPALNEILATTENDINDLNKAILEGTVIRITRELEEERKYRNLSFREKEKYLIDRAARELDAATDNADKQLEIQRKLADNLKTLYSGEDNPENIRLATQQKFQQKSLEALESYLSEANKKKVDSLGRDIDNSKRAQDYMRELAARGSEDAQKNIAHEEATQRKLEAQREKAIQRQKQVEAGLAVMKAWSSNLNAADGDSTKALVQTMKDATILQAFIKALPSYFAGIEDTGSAGGIDDKGGKLAVIHPHERIMTAEQNRSINGLTNWELTNAAMIYREMEGGKITTDHVLLSKLDNIEQAIRSQPEQRVEYDGITNNIITIVENATSIKRNHKRLSKLG